MLEYKEWDRMTADQKLEALRMGIRDISDTLNTEISRMKIRLEAIENKK